MLRPVEEMLRTSTWTLFVPPTRWNVCSTRTRKILFCVSRGMSAISSMNSVPRETQNKILRVLVEQTFQRVGGTNKVQVDVRIISSAGRNIEAEIGRASCRERE